MDLVLIPEVSQAIKEGKFHIWAIEEVFEAVEILMGVDSGYTSEFGSKKARQTVFGKAYEKLSMFDQELQKRFLDTHVTG